MSEVGPSETYVSPLYSPAFVSTGLLGATAKSRYAGGTIIGPPTLGYFQVGDFVVDQTGSIWVCTVAGGPGTWIQPTSSAVNPTWTKVTISYTSVQASALTNIVLAYTLGAKGIIQHVVCNVNTLFSGTGITSVIASLGTNSIDDKYIGAINMASTGPARGSDLSTNLPESFSITSPINLSVASTGANLSLLTQGSIDIWLLIATLP